MVVQSKEMVLPEHSMPIGVHLSKLHVAGGM